MTYDAMKLTTERNKMNAPSRPILRYHGGKWKLAPWIINHFPPHHIYTEPFGGAASVLMRKPRSYAEIYNDRWGIVVNVFRVMRDPSMAKELARRLYLTPFSRDEFENTGDLHLVDISDPIEQARMTILRSFAGFGSAATNAAYATGFRSNSNRSGTTPAHDWAHYPIQIPFFVERLQGVVIENRDAIRVIQDHDSSDTLHYVDPPYPHSTRNMQRGNAAYACEMEDDDHRELSACLHLVSGKVCVSGYACELYDQELYADWYRVERNHYADGASKRTEVLWMNYSPPQNNLLQPEVTP